MTRDRRGGRKRGQRDRLRGRERVRLRERGKAMERVRNKDGGRRDTYS